MRPSRQRARARALLFYALCAPAGGAAAQTTDQLRREVAAVGVVERLGAAVPRGATFTEAEGGPLSLSALSGRPALLSFNYTACPRLCSLQLAGLARGLGEMGWAGEGFQVATVSVDPAEKPAQLLRAKQTYLRLAGEAPGLAGAWHFLAGSPADVAALAEAVGFKYRRDPRTGELAHQATLVVLTGDGRVSSYIHGISYAPGALRAAVERAGAGRVASPAEQASLAGFLLTCMGFDPADPAPLALKVMRAGGGAALLFLVSFVGIHFIRDARRRRPTSSPDATSP